MDKRQQGMTLLDLMATVAIIGILASLGVATYQDYIVRAQVSEGITLSSNVRQHIMTDYMETGEWPNNNNKALIDKLNEIEGSFVKSVKVTGNQITLMYGNGANGSIFHRKIIITITEDNGRFDWSCKGHAQFPDRYLPRACQT